MIFDLVHDFADVLDAMPADHPRHRILKLLNEAIRRDVHFIDRHPTTLFQCMWNTCWWYDCPEAAKHYEEPEGGWMQPPPWETRGESLYRILEEWRHTSEQERPDAAWLRSVRPPPVHLDTGLLATFPEEYWSITDLAFSPDGRRFVSASNVVRVRDATTGRDMFVSHNPAERVTFSPDGTEVLVDSYKTVRVLDSISGAEKQTLVRSNSRGVALEFSSDGRCLMRATYESIRVWDAKCTHEMASLLEHEEQISTASLSPDVRRVAVGYNNGAVRIWDLHSQKVVATLPGHSGRVKRVAFSPDGNLIASCGQDANVRLWNIETGSEHAILHGHTDFLTAVAFSPDGWRLASCGADGTIRIWRTSGGAELVVLPGHDHPVICLAYSPDGSRILSGPQLDRLHTNDATRLWDATSVRPVRRLVGHSSWIRATASAREGECIVTASGNMRFFVTSPGEKNTIRVWNTSDGRQRAVLRGHQGPVNTVDVSADGRLVASGSADRTLRLWSACTGKGDILAYLNSEEIASVVLSPDGALLACGTRADSDHGKSLIRIWETESHRHLGTLTGHDGEVTSLAFSPNGRLLVSGSRAKNVYLWQVESATCLATLRGHASAVRQCQFSDDGRVIVSHCDEALLCIWDVRSHVCLSTHKGDVARQLLQAVCRERKPPPFSFSAYVDMAFLQSIESDEIVTWWPRGIEGVRASADGRSWSAHAHDYFCLLKLEGHQ